MTYGPEGPGDPYNPSARKGARTPYTPDGRPPRSRKGVVITLAVVFVLLLGGGAGLRLLLMDSSDDDGGGGGSKDQAVQAEVLSKTPMPQVKELTSADGLWTTDRNVVKGDVNKVVGYPLTGGSPQWEIPLSGEICWSAPHVTKEGYTAVLFEDASQDPSVCTQVGLLDLTKGKLVWQKEAVEDDGTHTSPMMFDEVTIGAGTVAAGGTSGGSAWSLDGTELWVPTGEDTCDDKGYAGGDTKLVVVRDCGEDSPKLEVHTLNPKTGESTSSFPVQPGAEYVHVASVDPLVINVSLGDEEETGKPPYFQAVDDRAAQGKPLGKITIKGDTFAPDCPATNVEGCAQTVVSKAENALYLGSERSDESMANQIVSFDLRTGKERGRSEEQEDVDMMPFALDEDGSVLAYQEAGFSDGGAVWRIDPSSHEVTKVLQNPADSAEMESAFVGDEQLAYANERLYLADAYARNMEEYEIKDRPLLVVFGAG